jgi:hypothetical protein
MRREISLKYEFVEYIPNRLEDRTIYISVAYSTAVHKCCCGCGKEVVTPLSPTDWSLTFNGVSISLNPSIGNWNFPCQSHYWIIRNKVKWASQWSQEEINVGRAHDSITKERYFSNSTTLDANEPLAHFRESGSNPIEILWQRLVNWFHR